jgi:hypothetical protein
MENISHTDYGEKKFVTYGRIISMHKRDYRVTIGLTVNITGTFSYRYPDPVT